MLRYGVRTAQITVIDHEYIRVSVRGAVATGHVYLYFLHSRFWENHPFSVASSGVHEQSNDQASSDRNYPPSDINNHDEYHDSTAKQIKMRGVHHDSVVEPGMVFYLRVHDGATKTLLNRSHVKVLIEGPYGKHQDLSDFPTMVCIAGGVGVTACQPYLHAHPGNAVLYWGVRSQALADGMQSLIRPFKHEVVVGRRLDLEDILGNIQGDFAVVVSGPTGMVEEVRQIASRLGRTKRVHIVSELFTL